MDIRFIGKFSRKNLKRVLMCIMALVGTGAVLYILWLNGIFLPEWVVWESGTVYDPTGQYEIVLRHRVVEVKYDNSVIWSSPQGVKVQKVLSTDIDGDGRNELLLLCWKIGRYGRSRPFWVEKDEKKWSQHLFVYALDEGEVRPKWMSSYIGQDVSEMAVKEQGQTARIVQDVSETMAEEQGQAARIVQDVPETAVKEQGQTAQIEQDVSETVAEEQGQTAQIVQKVSETATKEQATQIGQDTVGTEVKEQEQQAEHIMRVPRNRLLLTTPDGRVSSWIWDSWGFTREETEVSFVVFGDNLIHEPIYKYGLHNDGEFGFLYENMKRIIAESDIAVINQETPFTDDPAMYGDYPRFGTPVQVGEAMANAGFDVVTCATNHALDRGTGGVDFTKNFFESQGIVCLGIQSSDEKEYTPYDIVVRNGIRFAMLNYTYGTNGIRIPEDSPAMVHLLDDEERIRNAIESAKAESDFVIFFAHWGTEYEEEPDDFQVRWANILLESGVDVVVGTHPHTLQPYEVLRDEGGHEMLVYYSIGNYISAQPEQSCVKGGVAEFTVSLTADGYKVTEYGLKPLTITCQEGGKYTAELSE